MALNHCALFYEDLDEYLAGTSRFLLEGDAAGEALMAAIPASRIESLREALRGAAEHVRFVDMHELGRNPARIIPAVREWAERAGGGRCRFVGEPIWPERNEREQLEATRHEALLNIAFAGGGASILCPYDARSLTAQVLSDAERTHPELIRAGTRAPSAGYCDPRELWRTLGGDPPEPERTMAAVDPVEDLAAVRRMTERCGLEAGLGEERALDLVLAVHEALSDALRHGRPPARLRVWLDGPRLVSEVADAGTLDDPLAGLLRPTPDCSAGRGLWVINQLCDMVELWPDQEGTRIRLHMELE